MIRLGNLTSEPQKKKPALPLVFRLNFFVQSVHAERDIYLPVYGCITKEKMKRLRCTTRIEIVMIHCFLCFFSVTAQAWPVELYI